MSQALLAQTFTEVSPAPGFEGVSRGSIAFSDVNGDGNDDVLITGDNSLQERITKMYTNDGAGNFTEIMGLLFDGVRDGSVAFSDVNGDGIDDVLITGENSSDERIAKLYTNDGIGNFTELTGASFEGVKFSSIAFSDVNGDGYNDVLITGSNSSFEAIAKLYVNDGTGVFTMVVGTPFEGVRSSSVAFSDVNGDGNIDVLLTGEKSLGGNIAKLYINDGTGIFTEMIDTPFDGVRTSSIAFSDINGDGNEDVLLTGENDVDERIAKLYINDGTGDFTEMMNVPFDGVRFGSVAFSDVNGDGDNDVLITGSPSNFEPRIAKLYTNDGAGNFTETIGTPFIGVFASSIAFSDVNGDGNDDVLITGSSGGGTAKLYTNDGGAISTEDFAIGLNLAFTLYPNPVRTSILNVCFNSTVNDFTVLKVNDLNGRLLIKQDEHTVIGQQEILIDISSLRPGSYLLQIENGNRKGGAGFVVQ
ncbi:MAG: FG-GAP-like repeat-containing protein [Saprospiraceae bacterium]